MVQNNLPVLSLSIFWQSLVRVSVTKLVSRMEWETWIQDNDDSKNCSRHTVSVKSLNIAGKEILLLSPSGKMETCPCVPVSQYTQVYWIPWPKIWTAQLHAWDQTDFAHDQR